MKTDSLAAIKMIEAFLKTDDPETKRECLKILGLTNNKRAIKPLMAQLETSEGKILFKEAVLSLSKFLKEKQVFYALMKKMKDKNIDKETRLIILSTLSNSQQGKVFPYLINIINDRDDDLKLDAIKVIAETRDTRNAEALLKKIFDKIVKLI